MLAYQEKNSNEEWMSCLYKRKKKGMWDIKPICTDFDKTLHLSDFIMHVIFKIQYHLDIHLTIEAF